MSREYTIEESIDLIRRGSAEIFGLEEIIEKIKKGKQLIVKAGFDPTAPDIHIGHSVLLRKMKHFQELGHKVVFLIGDFTGRIGDPSGKSKTRPRLTVDDVNRNAITYKEQVFKILDKDKTVIDFNSRWGDKMSFADVLKLTSHYTVAQLLERDDFSKRYKSGQPIAMIEFMYPLVQAYDSVALEADIELGGTDQTFNLLVGRQIMKEYGLSPQAVITVPLLEGTDGVEKMSKSLHNYIGINESPKDIFGKAMSIPDNMILKYMEYTTDIPMVDVCKYKEAIDSGENPRNIKILLAKELVSMYHGFDEAIKSEEEFIRMFSKGGIPDDMPDVSITKGDSLLNIVALCMPSESKSNLKRLVSQGSVSIDNEKILYIDAKIESGSILKVGKRNFFNLKM